MINFTIVNLSWKWGVTIWMNLSGEISKDTQKPIETCTVSHCYLFENDTFYLNMCFLMLLKDPLLNKDTVDLWTAYNESKSWRGLEKRTLFVPRPKLCSCTHFPLDRQKDKWYTPTCIHHDKNKSICCSQIHDNLYQSKRFHKSTLGMETICSPLAIHSPAFSESTRAYHILLTFFWKEGTFKGFPVILELLLSWPKVGHSFWITIF